MMRRTAPGLLTGLCTWCLVIACGDNASQCGEGTVEVDGVCLPGEPPAPPCAPGTLLDVPTGTCVIDPAACTDGTILVGSECRDPGDDVVVDVLEAAEPNGFGVGGEASTSPAGLITLRAPGEPPVILKGTLAPHPGADYDTYVVDVTAPTLLDVTVDGTRGISGGLVALAEDPALAGWRRESVSLVGDAAHRQLYLPVAGRYHLAIADTRTLLVGAAVGDADASYLVALTALTPPVATSLIATGGVIATTGTVDERTPQLVRAAARPGHERPRADHVLPGADRQPRAGHRRRGRRRRDRAPPRHPARAAERRVGGARRRRARDRRGRRVDDHSHRYVRPRRRGRGHSAGRAVAWNRATRPSRA